MANGLRLLRERKGLTQADLAARSGVSQSAISHYESGARRNPSGEQLVQLARVLGVSADEVLVAIRGPLTVPDRELVPDDDPEFKRVVDQAEAWDMPLVKEWLRSVEARKRRRERQDCPACVAEVPEPYSA